MGKKKKLFEKLYDRLVEMGLEPAEYPKRIMAGYWQMAAGSWRWSCHDKHGYEIGSQDTMRECVNANRLDIYRQSTDIHISIG
jgi:hypothetical protein